MNLLNKLTNLSESRVNKYGAQYITFAIFGIINYPLAYIYEFSHNTSREGLWLRLLSAFLCLCLLLKNKWPKEFKKFIPLFWYLTIIITLPMLATFMLLLENFNLSWLINFNIGIMIAILLVDSLSFLFVTTLGIITGISLFYIAGYPFPHTPKQGDISLFIYMFFCIIILGAVFTRNKEIFNHYLQKTKDDLNISLEQKVQERTQELEKALSAKVEFLNNMSHEIRTPVLGFTSISEGLVENWDILKNEKKLKYVKDVANSAERLCSLISNILDLSTFLTNKMELNLRKIDLDLLINDIISETKILYPEKSINIKYSAKSNIFVMADKEWIAQALRQLFSNAIKFNSDEGVITIALKKQENNIHFSIADSGVGIPESEMKDIFTPFYQSTRTKTKAGGRGLGLAIAKEIIEAHKGRIWAENNAKGGATFNFTIPS